MAAATQPTTRNSPPRNSIREGPLSSDSLTHPRSLYASINGITSRIGSCTPGASYDRYRLPPDTGTSKSAVGGISARDLGVDNLLTADPPNCRTTPIAIELNLVRPGLSRAMVFNCYCRVHNGEDEEFRLKVSRDGAKAAKRDRGVERGARAG